jgi:hypothetical protein
MPVDAVSDLSSRVIHIPAVFKSAGLAVTTMMALSRAIGCSFTRLALRPPSPTSMMRSSSDMIASGALLRNG